VRETAVHHTPFCTRLHLEKDIAGAQPQVLLVAPMSGHFATLLRGTAQTILADHDVYISDWHNARDIGLRHGEFGFDEFIDHVTTFLQVLGPGVHVVGVCQPCSLATRHRRLPGGGRVIPSREDGEQLWQRQGRHSQISRSRRATLSLSATATATGIGWSICVSF